LLFLHAPGERLHRLAPQREPLARAAQAVERRRRLLARAGGVRQLLLGLRALREQRLEPLVEPPPLERDREPALLRGRAALLRGREVERGDGRAQAGDLSRELLGALGRGRLQRERAQ